MDELNLDEPNDDYWYAFGRIAEQYGERDIAIADYRKLKSPKKFLLFPLQLSPCANAVEGDGRRAPTPPDAADPSLSSLWRESLYPSHYGSSFSRFLPL
jgi:hypothetical protein